MAKDTVFRWNVTESAEKAAGLNQIRPPVSLWEEHLIKVPRIWNGKAVIERDSRISGGVYLFSRDGKSIEEALVVDDERSPELKSIYAEVRKRMVHESIQRNVPQKNLAFGIISEVINEVMPLYDGVVEDSQKLSAEFVGQEMDIGENIRAHVGVCRHKALVAGYVVEKLIEEGVLRGRVSIDRNGDPKTKKGHGWVRYTSLDGSVFILDPAKNVMGSLKEAMGEEVWDYRRPGEKVKGIIFPRMMWWNKEVKIS